MASLVVVVVYVVVGAGAAVALMLVGPRPDRAVRAVMMFALWPFLLPAALFGEPVPAGAGGRRERLEAVAHALREAFSRAPHADGRERRVVEAYVERIRTQDRSVAELEIAIDGAGESVKKRLEQLRAKSAAQIDEGIEMLEEMVAQLTLLRFSTLAEQTPEEERQRMEDLMARIEALADLTP